MKPRITLIGPTYPYRGGIAHYTTLLTDAFKAAGHETHLISFSRQYPSWLFPGKTDQDPSERPLQTDAEYLLDSINPLTWEKVVQTIKSWETDILIIPWWVPFWVPAWRYISWRVKKLCPTLKLIFICHNVLPHEKSKLDKIAIRLALQFGDGFLVHSTADGKQLDHLFPNAKWRVNPLPTYAQLGSGSKIDLPIPTERPLLLFFGFIRPYKGLDILLEALPLLLQQQTAHLLIAGEFWQGDEETENQIKRLGIEEHVTLINRYLPDEELSHYLQAADLVVLPYRSATQSAVVQTAFGHETAVVTTNVGGLAEAVKDKETGLIVPPENPAALAAAIARFFTDDLGPQFVENIRAENNGRFSWSQLVHTLLELASL